VEARLRSSHERLKLLLAIGVSAINLAIYLSIRNGSYIKVFFLKKKIEGKKFLPEKGAKN
jgi:hypothetical protein